jgi:dTMP kinase
MFITFEGGEGSGKSLQSRRLYHRLLKEGFSAVLTREPGGTPLGDAVTRWLKHGRTPISPTVELLLFNASRAQLVNQVIRPALAAKKVVVCDRYCDSTVVYQGYGRGVAAADIQSVNSLAVTGLKPDLTFLLDITPASGLARKPSAAADRFEKEGASFHEKVRRGYLALAHAEPSRWYILDASRPSGELSDIIWDKVSHSLVCRGK